MKPSLLITLLSLAVPATAESIPGKFQCDQVLDVVHVPASVSIECFSAFQE